ncbi:MAG: AI-2E family transporter [Emergencia sp.]|nr:AI-2E family transporter [Emergencia sp.]
MEFNKNNRRSIIGIAFACILFYLCLRNIGLVAETAGDILDLIFPFILGAGIAFVINVPMSRIEYWLFNRTDKLKKQRRSISFLVTLALVIGVIIIAMYIVIPQLAETLMTIGRQLPGAFSAAQDWVLSKMSYWKALEDLSEELAVNWSVIIEKISTLLQQAATAMVNSGIGAVTNIIGAIVSFFIGFVFAVYILMAKEKLAGQVKQILYALFKEQTADRILYVCGLSSRIFSKFISGQCLEACILGLMFFIAMTIFGMPYAMLISVLIAFTALIPMVGAFFGCAIGVLLILMVSPLKAFIFLIMFLILQQLEGNLIYPHVVGNSVGLPSIWVLAAITIGGSLMGVVGMIIFIPICSVLYSLFRLYIKDRLVNKGIPEEKWQEKAAFSEEVMKTNK